MKTMCLLSFPKVIFFPRLPSPHLSFPPSSFSSCSSSSSWQRFCLAENCSSCCDIQPLRKPQVELAKAYSQSLTAQFPPPWSAVAFVVLGLPVQALPTVGSVYRLPCDEPVLGASWQGQEITLPVIVGMPQDCLYLTKNEQPDMCKLELGIRCHSNMILNIKRPVLPLCFYFKPN